MHGLPDFGICVGSIDASISKVGKLYQTIEVRIEQRKTITLALSLSPEQTKQPSTWLYYFTPFIDYFVIFLIAGLEELRRSHPVY